MNNQLHIERLMRELHMFKMREDNKFLSAEIELLIYKLDIERILKGGKSLMNKKGGLRR